MKWECGEANYRDECPYPSKTLCTQCWAQGPAKNCVLFSRIVQIHEKHEWFLREILKKKDGVEA
jgi:hypothetical protein